MHSTVTSKNVSGFTLAGPPCIYRCLDSRSTVSACVIELFADCIKIWIRNGGLGSDTPFLLVAGNIQNGRHGDEDAGRRVNARETHGQDFPSDGQELGRTSVAGGVHRRCQEWSFHRSTTAVRAEHTVLSGTAAVYRLPFTMSACVCVCAWSASHSLAVRFVPLIGWVKRAGYELVPLQWDSKLCGFL